MILIDSLTWPDGGEPVGRRHLGPVRGTNLSAERGNIPAPEVEAQVFRGSNRSLDDRQHIASALTRSRLQARALKDALQNANRFQLDALRISPRSGAEVDQTGRRLRLAACSGAKTGRLAI